MLSNWKNLQPICSWTFSTKTQHSSTPFVGNLCCHLSRGLKEDPGCLTPLEEICFQASCSTISSFTSRENKNTWGTKLCCLQAPKLQGVSQIQSQREGQGKKTDYSDLMTWERNRRLRLLPEPQTQGTQTKGGVFLISKYIDTFHILLTGEVFVRSILNPTDQNSYLGIVQQSESQLQIGFLSSPDHNSKRARVNDLR